MFRPGIFELLLIMIVVLIVFGAGKLPEIGGALGKGIKNFRSGVKESPEQIEEQPKSAKDNENEKEQDNRTVETKP